MVKNYAAIFMAPGHDMSTTLYDEKSQEFITVDWEKLSRIKHFDYRMHGSSTIVKTLMKSLTHFVRNEGVLDEASLPDRRLLKQLYIRTAGRGYEKLTEKDNALWPLAVDDVILNTNHAGSKYRHHKVHCYSSFFNDLNPFSEAVVIANDGGGDGERGTVAYFNEDDNIEIMEEPNCDFATVGTYDKFSFASSHINSGLFIDFPGKYMGLSGYGIEREWSEELIEWIVVAMAGSLSDLKKTKYVPEDMKDKKNVSMQKLINEGLRNFCKEKGINEGAMWAGFTRSTSQGPDLQPFGFFGQLDMDMAWCCQQAFNRATNIIVKKYAKKYSTKNVILTGGAAYNVIANTYVREKNPDLNIWVPPNPGDNSLSFGYLWKALTDAGVIPRKKYKQRTGPIFDEPFLDKIYRSFDHRYTNKKEIATMLREGKIFGLMQGNVELGPRALGNRSILADPRHENVSKVLNDKIKKREFWRPFAPVCRLEDAPKWFRAVNSDWTNLEYMSFVVEVKDSADLPSITHIDKTARLQTVTREQNEFLYDLLTEFDGPLLNTSLNVGGMPIENRLRSAIEFMHGSPLDGIIYRDADGHIRLFE